MWDKLFCKGWLLPLGHSKKRLYFWSAENVFLMWVSSYDYESQMTTPLFLGNHICRHNALFTSALKQKQSLFTWEQFELAVCWFVLQQIQKSEHCATAERFCQKLEEMMWAVRASFAKSFRGGRGGGGISTVYQNEGTGTRKYDTCTCWNNI